MYRVLPSEIWGGRLSATESWGSVSLLVVTLVHDAHFPCLGMLAILLKSWNGLWGLVKSKETY